MGALPGRGIREQRRRPNANTVQVPAAPRQSLDELLAAGRARALELGPQLKAAALRRYRAPR